MKEYRIINARSLMEAEELMNQQAQEGWRVVGFTAWEPSPRTCRHYEFAIALERDV